MDSRGSSPYTTTGLLRSLRDLPETRSVRHRTRLRRDSTSAAQPTSGILRTTGAGSRQSGVPMAQNDKRTAPQGSTTVAISQRRCGPRRGHYSHVRTGKPCGVLRGPLTAPHLPLRPRCSGSAFTHGYPRSGSPLFSLHPGASRWRSFVDPGPLFPGEFWLLLSCRLNTDKGIPGCLVRRGFPLSRRVVDCIGWPPVLAVKGKSALDG